MDLVVFVAELEDVADLDGFAEAQWLPADGIEPSPSLMLRMSAMRVGLKSRPGVTLRRWYSCLLAPAMRFVRPSRALIEDDEVPGCLWMRRGFDADGAEVAGGAVEVGLELFGRHGTKLAGAGDGRAWSR